MKDRVPVYPGRVKLTPVSGQSNTYDMVRADAPTEEGTPLNTNTLLKGTTAELLGLIAEDSTPDDALNALYELATEGKISEDRLPTIPINKGGTGATTAEDARENLGTNNAENITAGTLNSSRLPTVPVSKGGTGATTAAAARENLGVAEAGDSALNLSPQYNGTSDDTETAFESWLEEQIKTMASFSIRFIRWNCYPAITGNHCAGWLYKYSDTYCSLFSVTYNNSAIFLKTRGSSGWLATQNILQTIPETNYGTSLPAAGTPGRIFFLKA